MTSDAETNEQSAGLAQCGAGAPAPAAKQEDWGRIFKQLGPAGWLAIFSAVAPAASGFTLIYFMKSVAEWLRSHQSAGVAIYAGAFAILSGVALLPTYAQAALGGYAFGMMFGLPAALVGFAGGAVIGYVIARRASGDRVARLVRDHPKWQAVRDALVRDSERNSFWKTTGMVALLRMPPNSPFALTNLVMASVKVPWASFVIGTVVGMLPRTAVAVWIGATVGMDDKGGFATPLWLKITGIVAGLAVLGIVAMIADRALKRVTGRGTSR